MVAERIAEKLTACASAPPLATPYRTVQAKSSR
jgi:hypothetical protein